MGDEIEIGARLYQVCMLGLVASAVMLIVIGVRILLMAITDAKTWYDRP